MSVNRPKIFLDSGDPLETKHIKGLLGYIDGQTTNPSLVAKNPEVTKFLSKGKKLTEKELLNFYKQIIIEIQKEVAGPVSVEVYADWDTKVSDMLKQAENMYSWGKNIFIKFPVIPEGLIAAHEFINKGGRVNMTLVFDQNQAAAAYSATLKPDAEVKTIAFVSPFIGRWDDRGYNGLNIIKNIVKMYKKFNHNLHHKKSHILVLAASIRNIYHLYSSIQLGADILTVPGKILRQWVEEGEQIPDSRYHNPIPSLKSILYQDILFQRDYKKYKVKKKKGDLLDEGLTKFVHDWKNLIQSS